MGVTSGALTHRSFVNGVAIYGYRAAGFRLFGAESGFVAMYTAGSDALYLPTKAGFAILLNCEKRQFGPANNAYDSLVSTKTPRRISLLVHRFQGRSEEKFSKMTGSRGWLRIAP